MNEKGCISFSRYTGRPAWSRARIKPNSTEESIIEMSWELVANILSSYRDMVHRHGSAMQHKQAFGLAAPDCAAPLVVYYGRIRRTCRAFQRQHQLAGGQGYQRPHLVAGDFYRAGICGRYGQGLVAGYTQLAPVHPGIRAYAAA